MPSRTRTSLDGAWDFRFEDEAEWRTIQVPGPWQAQFDDLRNAFGVGHYRRTIDVPEGDEVALVFGAASEIALVRVAGREVGRHEGGSLPFEMVVPTDIRGEAILEVDVALPAMDDTRYPERPFPEYPHGKQSWYGPLGGLWQSVTLESRAVCHIAHVAVDARLADGRVRLRVATSGARAATTVRARVSDPDGALVAEFEGGPPEIVLQVDPAKPWSPEAPNLYRVTLTLETDGVVLDEVERSFGFRTIEAREGRLFLNGRPLYLRGALDQDYYPDGICTPPSLAFLEDQARKAKALGLNCLRVHIKVPDPRYYEVADRLGLLVWSEIPNIERFTAAAAARLRATFQGVLARDGHHPSIIAWTIINEDWGTRLLENPEHRAWLADTYDWIKGLDPTRLVVDNSACLPNFHVKTDLDDFHYYRGLPERRAEWDRLTEEFAGRPAWSFSPHGDGVRSGTEPLILSEFGVWGLPDPAKLRDAGGSEPWWMESGPFWGEGTAYPHGVENRFDLLGLNRVFGGWDAFIAAAQWHQFQGLKYQLESIRARLSIAGYVITEFTDVHWEANGLLDLGRNPRVFHERFAEVGGEVVLVPVLERRAFWGGETIDLAVALASGGRTLPAGRLGWTFEGNSGGADVPGIEALTTGEPVAIRLQAPDLGLARCSEVHLSYAVGGQPVSQNRLTLALYPRLSAPALTVAAPDPDLAAYLEGLGYAVVAEGADVVVCRGLDAAMVEAVRLGTPHLVLADTVATGPTLRTDERPREPPFLPILDETPGLPAPAHHAVPGFGVVERHGTMWRGDWIGNFSWLARRHAFAAVPGGPMLDLSFDRVVPHRVLTGLQPWEYAGRVHAGVVVGWVHKPAACIAERPFGAGRIVATTFRLTRDPPGADPVAATLLRALVETAHG